MKYGLTHEEQRKRDRTWRPFFALLPVQLVDGRTAWLETVECCWVPNCRGGENFQCRAVGSTYEPYATPPGSPPPKPK